MYYANGHTVEDIRYRDVDNNSSRAVWARRREGGVACVPLVVPNSAVVPTGMDRGAGDPAAAPSVAFGGTSRACFHTAVPAAGAHQTRKPVARDAMQPRGAEDVAQPYGAEAASHVAAQARDAL